MITLNGHTLSQFQRCKRPHIIGRTHTFTKWRPQSLLAACLRFAVFNLSRGDDPAVISSRASSHFLAHAKNPGLDVPPGIDTYLLSMDYTAIIKNFVESLSRLTLLTLQDIPNLQLNPTVNWQFLSHRDDSGTLHRWEFVDYIPDDPTAELHSWEVFGDMAAADAPMTLHLVAIGRRDGNHQDSPWCRIFSQIGMANVFRFQRKKKTKLEGEWKPKYFSSSSSNTPKTWVDLMQKDNVLDGVIRHIQVKEISADHRKIFFRDALYEGTIANGLDKMQPRDVPFSRYACDHPYACPHQFYCYNTELTLDNAGIYTRKGRADESTML